MQQQQNSSRCSFQIQKLNAHFNSKLAPTREYNGMQGVFNRNINLILNIILINKQELINKKLVN